MDTQQRILRFVVIANWVLFALVTIGGFALLSKLFALGILAGGLIVTVNFHLLWRTLKKAFQPDRLVSHHVVIAKYYMRFFVSAIILMILISQHWVDPLGLFVGLSIVVTSIMLATLFELKTNFITNK
jgi:hypothetical protein